MVDVALTELTSHLVMQVGTAFGLDKLFPIGLMLCRSDCVGSESITLWLTTIHVEDLLYVVNFGVQALTLGFFSNYGDQRGVVLPDWQK